jgi:hypothetical protein
VYTANDPINRIDPSGENYVACWDRGDCFDIEDGDYDSYRSEMMRLGAILPPSLSGDWPEDQFVGTITYGGSFVGNVKYYLTAAQRFAREMNRQIQGPAAAVEIMGDGLKTIGAVVSPAATMGILCAAGAPDCTETGAAMAAVPIVGRLSFVGGPLVKAAVKQLQRAGTHQTVVGMKLTRQEAEKLIALAGGTVQRIERAHAAGTGHAFDHINYITATGQKATVRVESVGKTFIR